MQEIEVVAGVVFNGKGQVLLTSRPEGKSYAGYWEFAGGKVEAGETRLAALQREFMEELGLCIHRARPWLVKTHAYPHATVRVHFFRVDVDGWSGQPAMREGQKALWHTIGQSSDVLLLPANVHLMSALTIPEVFYGHIKTGWVGCNGAGTVYHLLPHGVEHASTTDRHDYVSYGQWRVLPSNERNGVWVMVDDEAQYAQVQQAEALLWRVRDEASAQKLLAVLAAGAFVPIVVVCVCAQLSERYAQQWHAAGVHGFAHDHTNNTSLLV